MDLLKKVGITVSATALSAIALFSVADTAEEIAERLNPVGSVCMAGECEQPEGVTAPMVVAQAGGSRSGEEVYKGTQCKTCHDTGVGNAPKIGDKAGWEARIAKGIDVLYDSVINGIQDVGMMPARGICTDCSDDELKAAVDYMVEQSQ